MHLYLLPAIWNGEVTDPGRVEAVSNRSLWPRGNQRCPWSAVCSRRYSILYIKLHRIIFITLAEIVKNGWPFITLEMDMPKNIISQSFSVSYLSRYLFAQIIFDHKCPSLASYLAPPVTLSVALCIIIRDYHEIVLTDGNLVQHIIAFYLTLRRVALMLLWWGLLSFHGWIKKSNSSVSLVTKRHFEHNGADLSAEIHSEIALWRSEFHKTKKM